MACGAVAAVILGLPLVLICGRFLALPSEARDLGSLRSVVMLAGLWMVIAALYTWVVVEVCERAGGMTCAGFAAFACASSAALGIVIALAKSGPAAPGVISMLVPMSLGPLAALYLRAGS